VGVSTSGCVDVGVSMGVGVGVSMGDVGRAWVRGCRCVDVGCECGSA